MTTDTRERRDYGFLIGLFTGTAVGAGLALWLAPRASSELRRRVTLSARELANRASEGYQQVSGRVSEAVEDLTKRGQGVRDDVADVIVRGATEVVRQATSLKTDRTADTTKPM